MLNHIIPVIFRCCALDFEFYELNLFQEIEHACQSQCFQFHSKVASFKIFLTLGNIWRKMSDEEGEVNYAKRQKIVHYGQVDSKASAAPEEGNVQVIQWCTDLVEKLVTAKFSTKFD